PRQAAVQQRAVRAGTVQDIGERRPEGHARHHRQRHAAHAGLQAPLQARADRRHRGVPHDRAAAHRRRACRRAQAQRRRRRLNSDQITTRRNPMRFALSASVAFLALVTAPAFAADAILSGAVTSASGDKMGGVTVSAKADGATITTTVFTDADGNYFFPPMAGGKYRVWAQALSFETAKGEVDLAANKAENFTLKPTDDYFRQLPGDMVIQALPEESEQDKKMKRIVRTVCTGCHTPSYILQHRFDEAGWNAILELMKHVNVYGIYQGADHKATGVIDYNQKELAAYLAKARGPESNSKIAPRPRPSGEAARVVFHEYDVPIDADANTTAAQIGNDGSDWSLGTPSTLIPGFGVLDAW